MPQRKNVINSLIKRIKTKFGRFLVLVGFSNRVKLIVLKSLKKQRKALVGSIVSDAGRTCGAKMQTHTKTTRLHSLPAPACAGMADRPCGTVEPAKKIEMIPALEMAIKMIM